MKKALSLVVCLVFIVSAMSAVAYEKGCSDSALLVANNSGDPDMSKIYCPVCGQRGNWRYDGDCYICKDCETKLRFGKN